MIRHRCPRVETVIEVNVWCCPTGRRSKGRRRSGPGPQLVHAAIEVGIAGGALRDARSFLRDKARPFFEAVRGGWAEKAFDDPKTLLRYGRLATQVRASEALLSWAAHELNTIGLNPADAATAARASVAVAQAKAFGSEVAVTVGSELFALSGASAADAKYDLDRHWRNARTHSIHDPADWQYHHVPPVRRQRHLPTQSRSAVDACGWAAWPLR